MGKPGIITEITRFSTHDGPGIRTTVFLKGCPLRCKWCSNPETQKPYPQLYCIEKICQGYGECAKQCPEAAIELTRDERIDRKKCTLCMACVQSCPYNVYQKIGEEFTLEDIIAEIEKDLPFYGNEGGVTLSGGEALYQAEFTLGLLTECKKRGISTVLDTSGHSQIEIIKEALKFTDLVLLDIKHMDPEMHRVGTGASNELILENACHIASQSKLRISFPLVPGFNDSDKNLEETARFIKTLGVEWVDINPLHTLGAGKYRYLGLTSPYSHYKEASREDAIRVRNTFLNYGLKTTIGRMM